MTLLAYQTFAVVLSIILIALYLVLLVIAFRRANFRDNRMIARTEAVKAHARNIEGPSISMLLLIALGTTLLATLIGSDRYAMAAGLFVAAVRGLLLPVGLWLLAFYWRERVTWL